uniref:Mitogen-activated protein kinase-binding protein 1 n=1 Tax=Timema tahoe TaxID=61484 RepID=A0A7R9IHQ2_9NEOP|nr:unnamed protein product [Timema tahoe]
MMDPDASEWFQAIVNDMKGYNPDIAFSPSNKYVVSVGSQHDMIIKEAVPLMGRSAILGEQRNNYFCDVACGHGKTEYSEGPVVATLRYRNNHMAVHPTNAKYPDAVALAYDPQNCKLTCIYNDHSMYIWDVRDIKRVGKSYSFLFHSACIWGVDMYPVLEDNTTSAMPHGYFWRLLEDMLCCGGGLQYGETCFQEIVQLVESRVDLMKVLYVDPDLTYLKDLDTSVAGTADKNDSSYDSRNGVRIHDLKTLQELCRIEAHDAEVLCLEYSRPESGHRLLASASRDRLIHVFNVDETKGGAAAPADLPLCMSMFYTKKIPMFTPVNQGAAGQLGLTVFYNKIVVKMPMLVNLGAASQLGLLTPGGSQIQFSRGHNVAGKTTLYDMEVDSGQKHILTACQDRSIRVYNVNTGKHSKSFKGSISEDGSLIKVVLDNSGIYAATSCTDKTLCIYDYYSGECMATMYGHSELVTGLKFTNDCRKLISASGDGCIFVWKVPHDMVVTMHARLSQQAARLGKKLLQSSSISLEKEYLVDPPPELLDPNSSPNDPANYRFTLTQLPFWAKKQMSEHTSPPLSLSNKQRDLPRGRWAQRLDTGEIKVKSVYDNDSVIQMPGNQEKKHDSDGSKDSSIDSGTELRNYMEVRQEGITSKQFFSEARIKEVVFYGPRIRRLLKDSAFLDMPKPNSKLAVQRRGGERNRTVDIGHGTTRTGEHLTRATDYLRRLETTQQQLTT